MPVIREYQSQTRTIGANQGPAYSADQFGAAQGRAMGAAGEAVQGVADVVAKKLDQQNTSDVTAKLTEKNAELATRLQQVIRTAQPGDNAPFEEFRQQMSDELSKVGEDARTAGARTFFQEASTRISSQLGKTASEGQSELAGLKAVQDYTVTQNSLSAAVMADPSSIGLQRELHRQSIENLVNNGSLPREKAIQLQTQGDAQISKAAMRGWIELNPDYAKTKLKSGEFDSTLGADGKAQMLGEADQAIRAKEIEQERRLREQERLTKLAQQKTQNNFLQSMVDKKLTAKDILNSNLEAFGSGSKDQFLDMLKRANSPDEKLKTDPTTMIALYDRIHLPDGDPNKLTDENELNKFFGRGLSMGDLSKLRDEMQGGATESGRIEMDMKKQVMDIARGKLTRSNPLTGFKDPIGDEQMARFQAFFLEEYKNQRANGKSATALLNPDSPDYLGKNINQYVRTSQQIMKDMVPKKSQPAGGGLALTPTSAPANASPTTYKAPPPPKPQPRMEGESAAAYLKRMKEGK